MTDSEPIPEPTKEFRVSFFGGPYDGREGTLPFLPTFLALHDMDGEWGRDEEGKTVMDFRLSEYIYLLTLPRGDEAPAVYKHRPSIDLQEWLHSERLP